MTQIASCKGSCTKLCNSIDSLHTHICACTNSSSLIDLYLIFTDHIYMILSLIKLSFLTRNGDFLSKSLKRINLTNSIFLRVYQF